MHVSIAITGRSYSPESQAYLDFFHNNGATASIDSFDSINPRADVVIYYMGMRSVFEFVNRTNVPEIHEYQSISTPPYSYIKNGIKKYFNKRPNGRIFLSKNVFEAYKFSDDLPFIYRDMGVDKHYYGAHKKLFSFDIVYCGSIESRLGLVSVLFRLAKFGYSIAVIGDASQSLIEAFSVYKKITFCGRLDRKEIAEIYSISRCGLNYMPDIYPFNVQTSTKLLEYCAAGLGIISSKYSWVDDFSRKNNLKYLDIELVISDKCIYNFDYFTPAVDDYEWSKILANAGLYEFVYGVANA